MKTSFITNFDLLLSLQMEIFNNFKAISLSHKDAPVEVRERVSLNEQESKGLLAKVKEYFSFTDALIVSTCNRTEFYYTSTEDKSEDLIKLITIEKGINLSSSEKSYFRSITNHQEAVEQLYRVSMGLDSQVVGDIQISNQVKNAYQWAADNEVVGPFLHRLMHSIFYTNKRVIQETEYRDGAASTSYAAIELVEDLVANVKDPRIMIVGLGEIGSDVCKNFTNTKIENIKIANRTHEKAIELANECGYQAIDFDNLKPFCQDTDVIISSLSVEKPFFDLEKMKDLNILSHKFFIDLSVPRSVDKAIEQIPGVIVYNIDDLQSRANKALEKRIQSIPSVENIITESITDFNEWSKEMEVSPIIHKMKNSLEEIRSREISKYVKKLDEEQFKLVDEVTKSLMQKVMKLPVLQLKAACKRGEAETLVDVLNNLFDLENVKEKS